MSRFRILSLDGGGIKGTFTAAFLAQVEAMTNKRIYKYFDLITGTSTGGIIARLSSAFMTAKPVPRFSATMPPPGSRTVSSSVANLWFREELSPSLPRVRIVTAP